MIRDKLRSETALAAFPSLRGSDGIGKTARKRGIFWPRKVHLIGSQRDVGGPDVWSAAYDAVSRCVRSLARLRPEPVYQPRPWISHDATISQGAAPHNPMDSVRTLLNQATGLGAGLGAGREMWVLGLLDESMGGGCNKGLQSGHKPFGMQHRSVVCDFGPLPAPFAMCWLSKNPQCFR